MTALPALDDWSPLTPEEVGELFYGYRETWAIAGGWAIDLFLGEMTRTHSDIDIQVSREEAGLLHRSFPGWLLYAAHGTLDLWEEGTALPPEVHNVWCRTPASPWRFQLMLGDFTETEYTYRRDARIRTPREAAILDIDGLPVVAPEIQLLYKSRLPNLPRDEHDMSVTLPHLGPERRRQLATSLRALYGDHPWLAALDASRPTHHSGPQT